MATLTRRKPFGSSVPRPENTRQNMFSMNQWLKTPDIDGRYHPTVRHFQAAIPEVLDALPRKYFQQPVSWMTRIFHQFDDVSLMAAQGIDGLTTAVDSTCLGGNGTASAADAGGCIRDPTYNGYVAHGG